MTNNIVKGNLLSITQGVLIHQVNNKGVMGSGIAKDIRALYPSHYTDYKKATLTLGSLVTTRINTEPFLGVIGIVAQDGYGYDRQYTVEEHFESCLWKIADLHAKNPDIKYYMPFNIGCGRGGADWKVISALIWNITPFITIIKL